MGLSAFLRGPSDTALMCGSSERRNFMVVRGKKQSLYTAAHKQALSGCKYAGTHLQ